MTGVVVPRGAAYLNTDSGLSAPGGFLDRLTAAMDSRAQYQGTLTGLAPALQNSGIPVSAPQGILGSLMSKLGISAPSQPAPAMPIAGATQSAVAGNGASQPTTPSGGQSPTGGSPAMAYADPNGGGAALIGNAMAQAIGQTAQKYGIDPMTALRVAQSEGGLAPATAGDSNSSFGPFQLHYASGPVGGGNSSPGLGDEFTRQTGLDARDPANAMAAIDFALKNAAQSGWGAFHGAAKAGVGAWQGISGAPAQATAYAPSGDGTPMMPQASASGPMPSQGVALASSNTPGAAGQPAAAGQPPDPGASGATASPGAVLAPLMANPATRGIGAQLWQGAQQQGGSSGMPGSMTLPAGMTPQALATMISTPQTMQMGLEIWQRSLYPQITKLSPNESLYAGTRLAATAPSGPMDVAPGNTVINPNTGGVIARTAPSPVKLAPGESLVPPQGGAPVASIPPSMHFTDAQGRVVASNPQSGASTDVTPSSVPSPTDLKAAEGTNANILDKVSSSKEQAIASSRTLDAISRQQTALDKGVFTGGGADTKLKIANTVAGMFGLSAPTAENTQEFIAAANSKAAELAKQLSNGGHTTNADLNMAKVIGGADINYSMNALREIGRAQQQIALDTINRHNTSVDQASSLIPAMAQRQSFYKVPVPTNTYDFATAGALARGRAALAQGVPRAVVQQRLQAGGVDPGRL